MNEVVQVETAKEEVRSHIALRYPDSNDEAQEKERARLYGLLERDAWLEDEHLCRLMGHFLAE